MTIGGSLFLIAVGAILTFAVSASVSGVDVQTVGVILMAVGAAGLVLGFVLYNRARAVVVTRDPRDPRGPVV